MNSIITSSKYPIAIQSSAISLIYASIYKGNLFFFPCTNLLQTLLVTIYSCQFPPSATCLVTTPSKKNQRLTVYCTASQWISLANHQKDLSESLLANYHHQQNVLVIPTSRTSQFSVVSHSNFVSLVSPNIRICHKHYSTCQLPP